MYFHPKLIQGKKEELLEGRLVVPNSQLLSFKNIENLIEINTLLEIDVSQNCIRYLDRIFDQMPNLQSLTLSINFIGKIECLDKLQNLQELNLSQNRIKEIGQLDKLRSLVSLVKTNLASNKITKMKNLNLPNLAYLNLGGNEIKYIENCQHLLKLHTLDIYSNKLTNIKNITLFPKQTLKTLNVAYNLIPIEGLDEIILTLKQVKSLKSLDFTGNEVSLHKYYRIKIYEFKNVEKLDNLPIQDFLRDYMKVILMKIFQDFQEVKQKDQFRDLTEVTRAEYLERIKNENEIKNQVLELIDNQKYQVLNLFRDYKEEYEKDLDNFADFATEISKKRIRGEQLTIDKKHIDEWQLNLRETEQERKRLLKIAEAKKELNKRKYIETKLQTLQFSIFQEKLYQISMKKPEVWRKLKMQEYEQMLKEEQQQRDLNRKNLPYVTEKQEDEFNMVNQQFENKISQRQKNKIDQAYKGKRSKAAKKIQNTFKGKKQGENQMDQSEELENVSVIKSEDVIEVNDQNINPIKENSEDDLDSNEDQNQNFSGYNQNKDGFINTSKIFIQSFQFIKEQNKLQNISNNIDDLPQPLPLPESSFQRSQRQEKDPDIQEIIITEEKNNKELEKQKQSQQKEEEGKKSSACIIF